MPKLKCFATAARARGLTDEHAQRKQWWSARERVCTFGSCMMFVRHESHAHIWVFNVSLVYPDPPCSDGLFVGAFKTFRSWHFLDDTRFLAESRLVFLRGRCKISRKNISPLLVSKQVIANTTGSFGTKASSHRTRYRIAFSSVYGLVLPGQLAPGQSFFSQLFPHQVRPQLVLRWMPSLKRMSHSTSPPVEQTCS